MTLSFKGLCRCFKNWFLSPQGPEWLPGQGCISGEIDPLWYATLTNVLANTFYSYLPPGETITWENQWTGQLRPHTGRLTPRGTSTVSRGDFNKFLINRQNLNQNRIFLTHCQWHMWVLFTNKIWRSKISLDCPFKGHLHLYNVQYVWFGRIETLAKQVRLIFT